MQLWRLLHLLHPPPCSQEAVLVLVDVAVADLDWFAVMFAVALVVVVLQADHAKAMKGGGMRNVRTLQVMRVSLLLLLLQKEQAASLREAVEIANLRDCLLTLL